MKVEHVILFEADVAAEVLPDDALPGWEESVIEELFQVFRQVYVLELRRAGSLLLHELDCFKSHV